MGLNKYADRRWSQRRNIRADVKVLFHNRTYYAQSRNIGLGGMFIDLNYVLIPRDAHVRVIMLQHGEEKHHVQFKTRVSYVTPQGYGLEFNDFDRRDFRNLQDILYESPYEIERIA